MQSGVISETGVWPFHALLYKNRGVLTGDVTFRAVASVSDLDGTLPWIKPPLAGAKTTYPGGFVGQTAVIGLRRDKTPPVGSGPGTVNFGAGGIAATAPVTVNIDSRGRFTSSTAGFKLSLAPATGLFRGTFLETGATKARTFRGVLFQGTGRGYGEFIGAPLTNDPKDGFFTGFAEISVGP